MRYHPPEDRFGEKIQKLEFDIASILDKLEVLEKENRELKQKIEKEIPLLHSRIDLNQREILNIRLHEEYGVGDTELRKIISRAYMNAERRRKMANDDAFEKCASGSTEESQ